MTAKANGAYTILNKGNKTTAIALPVFALLLILFTLRSPEISAGLTASALSLCAKTVIPSLFPFMVLSSLAASCPSPASDRLRGLVGKPLFFLLGISESSIFAFLIGLICGFPMGAKTAVGLYEKGLIDKSELSRLLAVSNSPSPAFLIGTAGIYLYGSKAVGLLLYAASVLSTLTVGVVRNLLFKSKKAPEPIQARAESKSISLCQTVTSSVTSSALSMLFVTSFIIFFSVLAGELEYFLSPLSLPDYAKALIHGFLELGGGVSKSARLSSKSLSLGITAATVGWSGVSALFQVISVTRDVGISAKPYILSKLATALICPLYLSTLMLLFNLSH